MNYLKQIFIATDQLINTIFGGWADETLSSRAYRRYCNGSDFWDKLPCRVIDKIFFWDVTIIGNLTIHHCEASYINEQERLQCPPEFRIENE